MARLLAHGAELSAVPPADELIAAYFVAHDWWHPDEKSGRAAPSESWTPDVPEFLD